MTDTRVPLRIGNDERNAAITALDEHLRAGRIDHEEYGERMAAASMAKTREQLDELFADLPQPYPFPPSWPVSAAAYAAPVWPGRWSAPGAGVWYDPDSRLWLPQGTQLASVGRRIGAFFLARVLFVVTLGVGYVVWGVLVWRRGQTPALQVLRMRAYRPSTGRVAGFWWMVLRDLVGRLVEQVGGILLQLTSFILFVSTKERRSLHDLIAGTVVLHDPGRTSRLTPTTGAAAAQPR